MSPFISLSHSSMNRPVHKVAAKSRGRSVAAVLLSLLFVVAATTSTGVLANTAPKTVPEFTEAFAQYRFELNGKPQKLGYEDLDALLSNAVKFSMPQGRIHIFLENQSLRIEDDGPGVSKTERESVFERFYRSPSTREIHGAGLGLAIARRVADFHGYRLSFTRVLEGHGAAVVLSMQTRYQVAK